MKRVAKWFGITVGGLLALIVLLTSGFYTRGRMVAGGELEIAGTPVGAVALDDAALIERGRHLTESVVLCVGCHRPDLGGGEFMNEPAFAVLPAPNLTAGAGGVGAQYGPAELERAVRHGVAADGRGLFIMPSHHYTHLGDDDLAAIIAYVLSRPPVDRDVGERKLGPIGGILTGAGLLKSAPGMIDHEAVGGPAPEAAPTETYGRYLTTIAACRDCHGPDLRGREPGGNGPPAGPNITPADGGAGSWTLEQFMHTLREGQTPDGRSLDAEHMPWPYFGRMSDLEIEAIWQHLRSAADA